MSLSAPKHESATHADGTVLPCLPLRLALLHPLAYKLATEIGGRGSDVVKCCRW
jgi:hypothetical protein